MREASWGFVSFQKIKREYFLISLLMFVWKHLAFILKDEVNIVSFVLFEGNYEEVRPLGWMVVADSIFSGEKSVLFSGK